LPAWHAAQVAVPLRPDCFANLECQVTDTRVVDDHDLFVLEVVRGRIRSLRRRPGMFHHLGYRRFIVDAGRSS
jgi:flavin reductase (DIM6/NTAB) family NADH-FMN oxidoreductase RutF